MGFNRKRIRLIVSIFIAFLTLFLFLFKDITTFEMSHVERITNLLPLIGICAGTAAPWLGKFICKVLRSEKVFRPGTTESAPSK